MPPCFHDGMSKSTLPVGVHNVTKGLIGEVLAVVCVEPQTYRTTGKDALTSFNVLLKRLHKSRNT